MELFLNFLNEADTSATTFFHEVICGIACADPVGALKIKTGEDVKKYFDNGTIIAVNSRLQKLDVMSLKQARFLSSMSKPCVGFTNLLRFLIFLLNLILSDVLNSIPDFLAISLLFIC